MKSNPCGQGSKRRLCREGRLLSERVVRTHIVRRSFSLGTGRGILGAFPKQLN